MAGSLGTIRGQMVLDVKQALAAYTAARAAHLSTMTALSTGSAALIGVGAATAGVGLAIGAGLMVAVNAAAEFERKLDYFGAVSASTQSEMDAIREKALQLGQDTIFSAGEIADSFVELGKAGVSAKDIIGGVGEGVAALGAAADIPLDTAATIIMSAVQTFGLSADHAVGVADKLAGAANASIVEIQDLGVSLKYAGGVAASLGIPFEDVNTALGLLGQYGLRGSTAGTSLRQILVSLGGATKKATNELRELGIITEDGSNKFFNADGSAKSLAEIFQILQEATAGMGDEQRLASLKTIFQNRALASAIALTKEGSAGFDEMAAAINKTTAAEVAGKRLDNLSGDIEILRGNIETLAIKNGSVLQDFFRGLVQGITSAVQWFANLDEGTQAFIVKALAISSVVLVALGAFGMFAGALLNVINLLLRLGPVFTLLGKGLAILKTGFIALGRAMLMNPIGLIITAIGLLVAAFIYLWNNNEGFRKFWINLWNGIKNIVSNVVDWFKGLPAWFSSVWNSIKSGVTTVWNNILAFFKGIPQAIMNFFLNFTLPGLLIQHWDTIWATIQTVWNNIINFFRNLPTTLANFFSELPGKIGYWIGYMAGTVIRTLLEWGVNAVNTVRQWITNVVTFISQLPDRVKALFLQMVVKSIQVWNDLKAKVTQIAVNIVSAIINFFQQLPGRVATFFSNVYNNVRNWMTNAYNTARTQASNILNGVVNFIRQLPGKVAEFFTGVWNNIKSKGAEAVASALKMGQDIFNKVRDAINGLPGLVTGIFNNVVTAIKNKITDGFNAVKDFGAGLWEGFKDGLGIHSPSYIERAMWAITDTVGDETVKLSKQVPKIQKLGNELDNIAKDTGYGMSQYMADAATQLADSVAKAQSMSRKMAAYDTSFVTDQVTQSAAGLTAGTRMALSATQSQGASGQGPTAYVKVDAPQNMDPEQVGTMVGRRTAYALGSNTTTPPRVVVEKE